MNIIGLYSKQNKYMGLPEYYTKSKGAYTWVENKKYLDMGTNGIGCNMLGFCYKPVDSAVKNAIKLGNNSSLVAEEERKLGELLFKEHPDFDAVRYTRTGGEAIKVAVEIGKSFTGKNEVLRCGYHGWHIESDDNVKEFKYNDFENFQEHCTDKVGVVITELIRNKQPNKKFFNAIKKLCETNKTVLIFDEITSGYRFHAGGYYQILEVVPDMVVFGKGISNGYPFSCVLCNKKILQSEKFVSSTYFTDRLSCAAVIKTIDELKKMPYKYIKSCGETMQKIWEYFSILYKVPIIINEVPELSHFEFDGPRKAEYKSIFIETMLECGILAGESFYPTFAHTPGNTLTYMAACRVAFQRIADGYELKGSIIQTRPLRIQT